MINNNTITFEHINLYDSIANNETKTSFIESKNAPHKILIHQHFKSTNTICYFPNDHQRCVYDLIYLFKCVCSRAI